MWKKPISKAEANDVELDALEQESTPLTYIKSEHHAQKMEQSIIGKSVSIKGDIKTQENLLVQGFVEGTIFILGNALRIGRSGHLIANIYAKNINIEGDLQGNAYAEDQVVVHKTGKVQGNIIAPRIIVEDGANLCGSVDMDPRSIEKHFPKAKQNKSQNQTESQAIPAITNHLKEAQQQASALENQAGKADASKKDSSKKPTE